MMQDVKSWLSQWGGIGVVTPLVTLVVLGVRGLGFLQPWELGFYDLYLRLRPALPPDDRIAIVGINEADIRQYDTPILPDRVYAELIKKLQQMQPRAIGFDMYRDVSPDSEDQSLQQIFRESDNLIGITKVIGDADTDTVHAPEILQKKGQIGVNDIIIEADSRVRRGFLYIPIPNGPEIPSFGVHLALHYLETEGQLQQVKALTAEEDWHLRPELFPGFRSNTGGYVEAKAGGYQILINYRAGKDSFEQVSLSDILEDRVPSDWGRDRIILIGAISESFNDLFLTPYSSGIFSNPEYVPGVEIQAHLASQVLSTVLEGRPPLRSWPDPLEWLWTALWAGLGAGLTWKYRYGIEARSQQGGKWAKFATLSRILIALTAVGTLVGSTYIAILQGWWLPIVPPLLTFLGAAAINISYQAYTAGKIRKTFGRYLSNDVVAKLLADPEALKLGGKRQKITILTSDLRGFTALSERFSPEQVVDILNVYLQPMLQIIADYGGTVNGLMGDGILALFGVPTVREGDAQRAVACAIEMQLAMKSVNEQMEQNQWPLLDMGIGINTGECVVGNLGSELYTEYSAIGSQVNLAFRVETYTKGSQILISHDTLSEIGETWVKIRSEQKVRPKGVLNEISIYEIEGVGEPYNLQLPQEQVIFYPLSEPLSVAYVIVEGKQVGDRWYSGELIKLSSRAAIIQVQEDNKTVIPKTMTNIKLKLVESEPSENSKTGDDVYAKVTEVFVEQKQFKVYFTYRSPEINTIFKTILEDSMTS